MNLDILVKELQQKLKPKVIPEAFSGEACAKAGIR